MLRLRTVPGSLLRLLEPFRSCFTGPTCEVFVALLVGLIAQTALRTVCGMLGGAGLVGVWHHSRAHRLFATARWDADQVGLMLLRLVIGWLVPVVIAVDDTMFRRWGRQVHAAHWGYDGSLKVPKGGKKLSRGNCFVVAAVVVELPFLDRAVALPVLMRLWRKGGPTKTRLARDLIQTLAGATASRGRRLHVVADSAYICNQMRNLPKTVTVTGPMPRHASLWHIHPEVDQPPRHTRRPGRPRVIGDKIGTPDRLRDIAPAQHLRVTRYGRTATVTVHEQRCQWRGVFGSRPVRAILITEPGQPTLVLVTTDLATSTAAIIQRYASRWAIEVCFSDAKNVTGVGQARNRSQPAVERTVPFGLFTHSIVIIWYHLAGHHPTVITDHRTRAPWYTTKTTPSYADMIAKLRRVLIAAQYQPDLPHQPTPDEIRAVQLAWANASA